MSCLGKNEVADSKWAGRRLLHVRKERESWPSSHGVNKGRAKSGRRSMSS